MPGPRIVSSLPGFPISSSGSSSFHPSHFSKSSAPVIFCRRRRHGASSRGKKRKGTCACLTELPGVNPSSLVAAASSGSMEPAPSLYPLHRCKIIHLVRHAQGFHNVAGEADYRAYESYEFLDASLTPMGWDQVARLRKHVMTSGIKEALGLVVVSPLTRTMQTAVGVFGGSDVKDGVKEENPPLMAEGVGKAQHAAISSSGCPKFVAVEWCREHMGIHPCDKRSPIRDYKNLFPAIDFSEIETDEDTWWKCSSRETSEELHARGRKFIEWILNRDEKRIAVVSHSSYLIHLLELFGEDCSPLVQQEIRSPYTNCELRTVVLADRRATSKIAASSDFPGGVPEGPSAGSDLADVIEDTGKELEDAVENGSL
ncbi:phosphoglycerate mutase-like protein 1 isoform X1 [Selaginella moellendorffii]|uniref:phosphoglycerate mutase-like protein 1 isoform X1 n=2 Tax=Selaginella moellendorffii TaxID=88036 RepID=UPI000D1C56CF|nr:phosphoglycerate mutase-like protein 1 isoform X1 [Selaginella moellendorffii]|eukprot:XP_024533110.1 phosphoglycerate mutase-like protein 1 isoform X1 [Selaginella moellendorffii]